MPVPESLAEQQTTVCQCSELGYLSFGNGRIETTVTRAKEVRAMAEKIITTAKDDSLHSKRKVLAYVTKRTLSESSLKKLPPDIKMSTAATAV
jgi:ribosomal protein L17